MENVLFQKRIKVKMETQIIEKSNPIYIIARSDENNKIAYFYGAVLYLSLIHISEPTRPY